MDEDSHETSTMGVLTATAQSDDADPMMILKMVCDEPYGSKDYASEAKRIRESVVEHIEDEFDVTVTRSRAELSGPGYAGSSEMSHTTDR